MRLEALKIRHLGPFRDFAVDLADYDGATLIAVTGQNGAGKSTMLELAIPGALYRSTPTRGSLVDLATARDAMLEARVEVGRPWTIRHLVDKVSGKSEALVLDGEGRPVLDDAKVRSFDRWAAKHLPAPEVLFSSIFAPQGASGFLGMKPGERKAVLLRVLGVERLEALAAQAGAHVRESKAQLGIAVARLQDERARGGNIEELERAVHVARYAATAAEEHLKRCRAALARREEEGRERDAAAASLEVLTKQAAALRESLRRATQAHNDLAQRASNNRGVLAEARAIREAVAETDRLRAELAESQQRVAIARADAAQLESSLGDARQSRARIETRIAKARERLSERDRVERAAAELPELEEQDRAASARHKQLEDEIAELSKRRLAGAEGRIASLREGLRYIADGAFPDPANTARQTLELDDAAVRLTTELPKRLAELQTESKAAFLEAERLRLRHVDSQRLAGKLQAVRGAAEDLDAAERELADLDARHANAEADAKARRQVAETLDRQAKEQSDRLRSLEPLVRKAEPLSRADARLAELEPQLAAAAAERDRLDAELRALPLAPSVPPPVNTDGERAAVAGAEAEARGAHSRAGSAEQQLEAARTAQARIQELDAERSKLEAELSDWTRLAADLGRDGLQAAEIDAAGPELTELVNDLLHTCVGSRFSISIETTRLSADGKKTLEGCEVRVIDTERGRDAEASTFSGGERVIIGEAVSLALSMLACRRAGLEGVTLVRDESGAALDQANARAYVAMLRRSAELVRAKHVLFVSHSPEVIDMADAKIEVG